MPSNRLATEKQIAWVKTLLTERIIDGSPMAAYVKSKIERGDDVYMVEASAVIDELKWARKIVQTPDHDVKVLVHYGVTEPGMYRMDDIIYKVQAAHGSGNLYAKMLVIDEDGKVTFEYAPGVVRDLLAGHRMTLDEAKAFGAQYGTCVVCGRTLTKAESIEAGIGPVCAGRI